MGDRDERQQRSSKKQVVSDDGGEDIDPRLKSCDPELIEKIEMEIVDNGDPIAFDDIGTTRIPEPSVIFIDEIDSLLTQRSSEENEASRRMKTEFLVQLDGAGTKAKDIILVVGATNRPQELDEAARRRFVKRLYIPLPSFDARLDMINRLLKDNKHELSDENTTFIAESTKVRPINLDDFNDALRGVSVQWAALLRMIHLTCQTSPSFQVRSSVATKDLAFYKEWNEEFGSFAFESHEG
ncbi:hypothetical protein BBJ28_00025083 [Nothophytophthora sp. Chile5]|nr:hypothetical protein BBJ28_00025083 [Nothophytophthora sp. Chile5]